MRFNASMLLAKGSTLMVKIDVLQRDPSEGEGAWQLIGNALVIYVARDSKTHKAIEVQKFRASKYDELEQVRRGIEIGMTIKEWTLDKSRRDLHFRMPDYTELAYYQAYLSMVGRMKADSPGSVKSTASTKSETSVIMQAQHRNIHGNVFGGYLMRKAFDTSLITAIKHSKGVRPELLRVD